MRKQRRSMVAIGVFFLGSASGCTQRIEFDPSQSTNGLGSSAPALDKAESATAVMPDWSGNVQTAVFYGPWSGWNSHNTAFATVGAGYVLVGGGWNIDPGPSETPGVLVTASFPYGLSRFTWAVSTKDHMYVHSHRVRAFVIGLKLTGMSVDQMVSQMEIQSAEGSPGSTSEAVAQLSAGMLLVGGGASTSANGAGHLLTMTKPFLNGWRAMSKDHGVLDQQDKVYSYAIGIKECPQGFPLGCLKARSVTGPTTSCNSGFCTATIEQSDPFSWSLTGIGAISTYNGAGRLLSKLSPLLALVGENGERWVIYSKDHGFVDTGLLTPYVVELQQRPNPPG